MFIKKSACIALILFCFYGIALGETAGIELNVNASDVEGKFEFQVPHYEMQIVPGAGVLYSDDNYLISNLNISVRDQLFSPALSLGLGFKGIYGEAEYQNIDYDIAAIGFVLTGAYDFRKDNRIGLPVSVVGTFSGSPAPLSFADTDYYFDFNLSVYAHIITNASIVAGYRHINAQFNDNAPHVKVIDNAIFMGCKLTF